MKLKRITIILSLLALVGVFSLPFTGTGQPQSGGAGRAQGEIQLLTALNRAGLSLEQLQTLQGAVQALKAARAALDQEREALRAFLVSWTGTPEAFEAALQQAQQGVKSAQEALQAQRQALVDAFKRTLTVEQAEVLRQSLGPQRAAGGRQRPPALEGAGHRGGPSRFQGPGRRAPGQGVPQLGEHGRRAFAPGRGRAPMGPGQHMMGQPHRQGAFQPQGPGRKAQRPFNLGALEIKLDLLDQVLSEKIAALQGQQLDGP